MAPQVLTRHPGINSRRCPVGAGKLHAHSVVPFSAGRGPVGILLVSHLKEFLLMAEHPVPVFYGPVLTVSVPTPGICVHTVCSPT